MHNFRNVILNAITALFCVQHEVIHGVHLATLSNNARVVYLKTVLHYWRIARDLGRLSVMQIRGISSGRTIKLSKWSRMNRGESILSLKRERETAD